MATAIERLLGVDQTRARAVTHGMSMGQMCDLSKRLIQITIQGKAEREAAIALVREARRAYEERNKILHSFWAPVAGGDVPSCINAL